MIAPGFGFTRHYLKEWNNSVYFRPKKMSFGFKDQARAHQSREKCGLETHGGAWFQIADANRFCPRRTLMQTGAANHCGSSCEGVFDNEPGNRGCTPSAGQAGGHHPASLTIIKA
jgi:hypothetical protein